MNIYISNLSKGVTEETLRESFEHLGIIERVKIVFAADEEHQKDFAVITLMPSSYNKSWSEYAATAMEAHH
jgi:RNA recognition motif-containing protein